MHHTLTLWYDSYQYQSCLLLPFHRLQGLFFCINSVCYGVAFYYLFFCSTLLQLVYLFRIVGENGAAVGKSVPTASNTKAMISDASQALRSDFDNVLDFSY